MWFVDSSSESTPLPCGCDVAGPHVHLRSQLAKVVEPLKPSAVPAALPALGSELPGTKRVFCGTNSTVGQPPQPREPPAHQHGPSCGHKRIRHGDHFDYIVPKPDGTAELHHPYKEPKTGEERYNACPPLSMPMSLHVHLQGYKIDDGFRCCVLQVHRARDSSTRVTDYIYICAYKSH